MPRSAKVMGGALLVLALLAAVAWGVAFSEDRGGLLRVSFLDVGQGDAVFIEAPSGRQVLIDGGPGSSVLRPLSSAMPWYDRSIDVIIPTHPDVDHVSGLIDVLARYRVSYVLRSSVEGSTPTWAALERSMQEAAKRGANIMVARRGQIIDLGDGAYLEILSPDREVPHVETNTGCVVTRLVYGKTAFMFPCDAPQEVENYLVYLDGSGLRSDVLKAGHHGSKNSSSALFLGYVDPSYGVFSRGCDNRYGHPAPEVVERFKRFGVPTEDTCTEGTVTFVSDGQKVSLR